MKLSPRIGLQCLGILVCLASVCCAVELLVAILAGSLPVWMGSVLIFISLGGGVGSGLMLVIFRPSQLIRFGGAFQLHRLVDRSRRRERFFSDRIRDLDEDERLP